MIHNLQRRIDELRGRHVLVLGDLILDRYTWGNAERVSPEAPVLVLRADEHEVRPGGAASVAMLLRHLEAKATLAGVVGDDAAGRSLLKILYDEKLDHDLVCSVSGRPTTTKERFVGRASNRHPHQMLRVDHETREAIDANIVSQLRNDLLRRIPENSVIIISDYAKGVCTPELLNAVIYHAHTFGIPVVVDPARIGDYSRYRRASLVTPNRNEAELATGIPIESPTDALNAGRELVEQFSLGAAFITIDRDGIAVVESNSEECIQNVEPAALREVYDITGAGDMVIAITGLCQAAGVPLSETAQLANIAAGLEIEQFGIAPVSWEQITQSLSQPNDVLPHRNSVRENTSSKIVTLGEATIVVEQHRGNGKRIVFTNGCFDLLHAGHVTYLQEATKLGDVLIVAINNDSNVRALKGPDRPVISELNRATMLAALGCVDHVLVFDEPTPHRILDILRPDVMVKGGSTDEVIGREVVEAYGGEVCTTETMRAGSTTEIIKNIRKEKQLPDKNEAVHA
jgi:D-beta-D-heptose 7-phosphate kinase / D-beta-D-heptose 1-phosphate adenosyltransferase